MRKTPCAIQPYTGEWILAIVTRDDYAARARKDDVLNPMYVLRKLRAPPDNSHPYVVTPRNKKKYIPYAIFTEPECDPALVEYMRSYKEVTKSGTTMPVGFLFFIQVNSNRTLTKKCVLVDTFNEDRFEAYKDDVHREERFTDAWLSQKTTSQFTDNCYDVNTSQRTNMFTYRNPYVLHEPNPELRVWCVEEQKAYTLSEAAAKCHTKTFNILRACDKWTLRIKGMHWVRMKNDEEVKHHRENNQYINKIKEKLSHE